MFRAHNKDVLKMIIMIVREQSFRLPLGYILETIELAENTSPESVYLMQWQTLFKENTDYCTPDNIIFF